MNQPIKQIGTLMLAAGLAQAFSMPAQAQDFAANELKAHVAQEKQKLNIYQARFPTLELARKAAISFHANLLEANYEAGYLIVELNPHEKAELEKFGFKMRVAHEFISKRNAMLERLHAAGQKATLLGKNATVLQGVQQEAIPSYPCYETVEETYTAAQGFTTTYPNLASWSAVGKSWQKLNNLGGYDLYVLKLTNKQIAGSKPKLFIQSAMRVNTPPRR
jgi:hypothetical protein